MFEMSDYIRLRLNLSERGIYVHCTCFLTPWYKDINSERSKNYYAKYKSQKDKIAKTVKAHRARKLFRPHFLGF